MDVNAQRVRLLGHLLYYKEVLPKRDAAYNRLKREIVIPRIHRALKKIEAGIYHICDDCAESIPNERLDLIPGALRCVSCQTANENPKRR